ncbi:hypothetical protein IP84_13270 [beta proteobacterium AAP99]|nr:hypothetical protein IP84_13270 [beta proteobacterium AAP99]
MQRRTSLQAGAALAATCAAPGFTQAQTTLLTPDALRSDLALLRRALEALHPGLHRYNSPTQMAARFDVLDARFRQPQTLAQAYLDLSALLASIRCGHTYLNFYNQPKPTQQALFAGRNILPLRFAWIGGEMVVTDGLAHAADIPRGSVIERLNGQRASALLAQLTPLVRVDGNNNVMQPGLLSADGADEYETFDVFQGLLRPDQSVHRVVVRTPSGQRRTLELPAMNLAERQALRKADQARIKDAATPVGWTFGINAQGVGTLSMPGWAVYNTRWDWKGWLDGVFTQLASEKARGLIIDLRGNEGGLDCGDEILARLIDQPIDVQAPRRLVRFREVPADLVPYLSTWDKSFRTLGKDAEPEPPTAGREGFLHLKRESDTSDRIEPKGPRFAGRTAVLVDAANHSATFRFNGIVRRNRLAPLIGEPTGGNQRGINGGAFFFMTLPATQIEADIPLIGYFAQGNPPDAGFAPDVLATRSAADLAAGADRAMQAALRHVVS